MFSLFSKENARFADMWIVPIIAEKPGKLDNAGNYTAISHTNYSINTTLSMDESRGAMGSQSPPPRP